MINGTKIRRGCLGCYGRRGLRRSRSGCVVDFVKWLWAQKAVLAELAHRFKGQVMAHDRRIVRIRRSTQGKRGAARGLSQLSELQYSILMRLFDYHMIEATAADGEKLKEYCTKGAPWSAKGFFGDSPTKSQTVTLSKSLKGLKRRGLVIAYDTAKGRGEKPRTTHVKLTDYGIELTFFDWMVNSRRGRETVIGCAEELAASGSADDMQKLKMLELPAMIALTLLARQALAERRVEQLSEAEDIQAEEEEMGAALERIENIFNRPEPC